MCWQDADPDRWKREQTIASELLEDSEAGIDSNRTAFIRGTLGVYSEHGHLYEAAKLRIEYPKNFPYRNQPPSVYLESHQDRWKNSGNCHIESNWKLCLFVPGESGINFADSASLNDLFAVIHTFLFKQRIYQKRLARTIITGGVARWPGEDRSHGEQGIREAIRAMGGVGRNAPCPCGSGLKYKKCHMRMLERG
jgi:hypothetical protein